jgi:hypothetical protein
MAVNYTHTIFGRPVRVEASRAMMLFEEVGREATFDVHELARGEACYPGGKLTIDWNRKLGDPYRQPFVMLRAKGGARPIPIARVLETLAGTGLLKNAQVRYKDGDRLNLLPANRVIRSGPVRGTDQAHQETSLRSFRLRCGEDPNPTRKPIFQPAFLPPELTNRHPGGLPPRGGGLVGGCPGVIGNGEGRE